MVLRHRDTGVDEAARVMRLLNDHSTDVNSVRTRTERSHVHTGMSEWVQIGSDSARGEDGHESRLLLSVDSNFIPCPRPLLLYHE